MTPMHIARRYATAILELAGEAGSTDVLVDEIGRVAAAYEASAELRAALADPVVTIDAKRAIVREVADRLALGQIGRHALFLLTDRRRLGALPAIAQLLREMNDLRRGVVRAEVTTAVPLGEAYYARLQTALEKMTGRKVVVDRKQDPSLIAGVVTRIGDTVLDGSLRARLDEMRHALLADQAG